MGGRDEAQVGQGPITMHSEELVSSDRGVSPVRRILRRQLEAVAEGRDPIGVGFDEAAPPTGWRPATSSTADPPAVRRSRLTV